MAKRVTKGGKTVTRTVSARKTASSKMLVTLIERAKAAKVSLRGIDLDMLRAAPAAPAVVSTPPKPSDKEMAKSILGSTPVGFAPGLINLIGQSNTLTKTAAALTDLVSFTIAPQTVSGEPIQAQRGRLAEKSLEGFRPKPAAADSIQQKLASLGFEITRVGRFGITARGPAKLVTEVLGVKLAIHALPRRDSMRATRNFASNFAPPRPQDLYVAPTQSLTVKTNLSPHIDDFVFVPPPTFFSAPSADPPDHSWPSLNEAKIRKFLGVPPDASGAGVKVAIIDTGTLLHPYYSKRGLDLTPTAGIDEVGHGTAVPYNTFAVAPKTTVIGFQQTDPPQNAMEEAADAGVDIMSCSWGWDYEQSFPILEATIRDIVNEGHIVLFAAGNGHQAWPGSMPDVLSIGGVFASQGGKFEASAYASGFTSNLYPGRNVPDVSGLCGMPPKGIYIMMPCPPGCSMERDHGGMKYPDRDETKLTDGWLGASGTSSATPQIAGVAALLVEKARTKQRKLTTADVRDILQRSAVPVTEGRNAQGFPAVGSPNIAVGHGLVHAGRALALV